MTPEEIQAVNERSAEQGHRLRVEQGCVTEPLNNLQMVPRDVPPCNPYTYWDDRLYAMKDDKRGPMALWKDYARKEYLRGII